MYQATSAFDISASSGARKLKFVEDFPLDVLYKHLRAFVNPPSCSIDIKIKGHMKELEGYSNETTWEWKRERKEKKQ